jgi:hypothetical protein
VDPDLKRWLQRIESSLSEAVTEARGAHSQARATNGRVTSLEAEMSLLREDWFGRAAHPVREGWRARLEAMYGDWKDRQAVSRWIRLIGVGQLVQVAVFAVLGWLLVAGLL